MNPLNPMNEVMLNASLHLFSTVSVYVSSLVGLVFIMRLTFLAARVAGAAEYADVILDTVKYFAVISLFPMIVRLILDVTSGLAAKIGFKAVTGAQESIQEFVARLFSDSVFFKVISVVGDVLLTMFVQSTYTVLLALIIAISPIAIFITTVLNFGNTVTNLFGTILYLSLWPVLWNLLGTLGKELWPYFSQAPGASVAFWLCIVVMQILSPLFCYFLFGAISPNKAASTVTGVVRGMM